MAQKARHVPLKHHKHLSSNDQKRGSFLARPASESTMDEHLNYIATHLRRSDHPARVDGVRLLERRDGQFENRGLVERDEVITLLADGEVIFTWDHDAEALGDEIDLVLAGDEVYLRVDGQQLTADNLGALPEV